MNKRQLAGLKVIVFCACLVPLGWAAVRTFGIGSTSLGPNPVQELLHSMGKTGLNMLLITLAVTPVRQLTGLNWLIRLRRMLGQFAFFYVAVHLLVYALLDLRLAWDTLAVDITQRPYITVGMLAIVALIPLSVTSTNAMQRRLGRKWKRLHQLIYPIAVLGVVHYYWQTRGEESAALTYTFAVAVMLGYRLVQAAELRAKRKRAAQGAPHQTLNPP